MRNAFLTILVLAGCTGATATAGPGAGAAGPEANATSRVWIGTGASNADATIRVSAGTVQVRHHVPPTAKLGGTLLEGIDDNNRHLRYSWQADGTYRVDVTGRYRHRVTGSITGTSPGVRLESELRYRSW